MHVTVNRYNVKQYIVRPPTYWLDETGEHTQVIKHIMPIDHRVSIRLVRRVALASTAFVVVMTLVTMAFGGHRATHIPDPPPAPGNVLAAPPPATQLSGATPTASVSTDPAKAADTTAAEGTTAGDASPLIPTVGARVPAGNGTVANGSGVSPSPSDAGADEPIAPLFATDTTATDSAQPQPSPQPPTYQPPPPQPSPTPYVSPPPPPPPSQPEPQPSKKPHPPHPSKSPKK